MKWNGYIFEGIDLLEYHLHKISLNRGSSCINSPEWLKNKSATINPKNTMDNECFKYPLIAALHHQEIGRDPQEISKTKLFINNYDWKDIEFPSHSNDWRKFEQNNKKIAVNLLYVPYNTKQIRPAYTSKYNHNRDNQVNLLMITSNKDILGYFVVKNTEEWYDISVKNNNWHYLAVKNIPGLLRGITSDHCFHLYRTKKKLKKHERICRDNNFC